MTLTVRYEPKYRGTKEAIENIRLLAPSGERVSLAQLCNVDVLDGASEIYREGNSRYVALKYALSDEILAALWMRLSRKLLNRSNCPWDIRSTGQGNTKALSVRSGG